MLLKLAALLLWSSPVIVSLKLSRSIESYALWDHKITYYPNYMPVSSIVEPLVTTTISILTNAVAPRPNPTADTIFTKNSSAHARSTESRLSRLSLTVVLSGTPAAAASQSITTSTVLVSGENGMPACAYIVAADTGPNPVCAQDHCDCDGTIAPLLSSSVSGTWTTNCDYTVQPVTSALTRVPYVHARLIPALYSNTA
ncbi:hypothetical protein M430DRAFT_18896 [Amorphotheca resinae ATCC 22711]|uniref:Uncharacterized protein n=1 Tax=Amorphotheca resinae ATCC 22711 TaxID=857342 RepID=A0A2T3B152_AMORE|nr:hypothetical protein M430DRAFT_18896 [Amorphotheca resinae ATCC 22711]PSS18290.1 hypothetical protein M430DRAFT_18896 [Amorphotheca resinae ATCC 22711]